MKNTFIASVTLLVLLAIGVGAGVAALSSGPHYVKEKNERWAVACMNKHTGALRLLFVGNRTKPGKTYKCSKAERIVRLVYVTRP